MIRPDQWFEHVMGFSEQAWDFCSNLPAGRGRLETPSLKELRRAAGKRHRQEPSPQPPPLVLRWRKANVHPELFDTSALQRA
jgi:hypothetical protein